MISCKQIATLAQSAREAIAAGEKWMRIEEDCLAILELANLATIGLVTKQQAEHAGVEPPHCYAFKTCSSPAICAKAGHCVNTFDAQQQAEPGADEQALFEAAITKLSETTTFEKVYEDTELNSFWALWKEARAAQSGQRADVAADTTRLDWMLANDAFMVWKKRDDSILQCQVYTQDDDENYHVLSGGEHRYFNAPREAIDAAIAAAPTQQEGE